MSRFVTPLTVKPSPSNLKSKKSCDCDDCSEGKECPCDKKAMSWLNTGSGGALVGATYKPKIGDEVSVVDSKGRIWIEKGIVTYTNKDRTEVIGDEKTSGIYPNKYLKQLGKDLSHKHQYSSTQFDLAQAGYNRTQGSPIPALQAIQDQISDADLAEDGKEDNFHITCKYGLHSNDANEVREVVKQWMKLRQEQPGGLSCTATLGEVSLFPAGDSTTQRGGDQYDVVKVEVTSPDLEELNQFISDNLEHTDTHPIYQPHVTLAYVRPGMGKKYAGLHLNDHYVILHKLVFSDRDGEKTVIDFWDMDNIAPESILPNLNFKVLSGKPSKQNMEGKPCTVGHNAERDGCIPNDGENDEHSSSDGKQKENENPYVDKLKNHINKINSTVEKLVKKRKPNASHEDSNISVVGNFDKVEASEDAKKAIRLHTSSRIASKMKSTAKEAGAFFKYITSKYRKYVFSSGSTAYINLVGALQNQWADTSKDNPLARAVQKRVASLFKLNDFHLEEWDQNESMKEKDKESDSIVSDFGSVIDDYLSAAYENTQETFKAMNVNEITIHRGSMLFPELDDDVEVDWNEINAHRIANSKIHLNPLSSFSLSYNTAAIFSRPDASVEGIEGTDAIVGVITSVKVPVDRVFSCFITGVGNVAESEVVVLGGVLDAKVQKYNPGKYKIGNHEGKDLSIAVKDTTNIPNVPKQDLHGKPCGVGQNAERDGCIPNDGQQPQQPTIQQPIQAKPVSGSSANAHSETGKLQFDPNEVQELPKPSVGDVLGNMPKTEQEIHAKADEVVNNPSFLRKMANLPKAAVTKTVNFVTNLYAKAEAKYGSRWAKAIVGTAIVTMPTPFTLASVGAMTGLAHLWTKYVSKTQKALEEMLDMDKIRELAEEFLAELYSGLGITEGKDLSIAYNKSDVEGQPCTPGHTELRDGCIPNRVDSTSSHSSVANRTSTYTPEQIAEFRNQIPRHKIDQFDEVIAAHESEQVKKKPEKIHPRIKELIKQSNEIEITDNTVNAPPMKEDDYEEIERVMTAREKDTLEDKIRSRVLEDISQNMYVDVDRNEISDSEYDQHKIYQHAQELLDIYKRNMSLSPDLHAEITEVLEGWYENENGGGEYGVREIKDILMGYDHSLPSKLLDDWKKYQREVVNVTDTAVDRATEKAIEGAEENALYNYDDSEIRHELLREFYRYCSNNVNDLRFRNITTPDVWGRNDENDFSYNFQTGSGNGYEITVYKKHIGIIGNAHTLQFADASGSYAVTGAGGAVEVFSKVTAAVVSLMNGHEIPILTYTAEEKSRQKLYDRLTKTVLNAMPDYDGIFVPSDPKRYIIAKRDVMDKLKAKFMKPEKSFDPEKPYEEITPEIQDEWFTEEGWEEDVIPGGLADDVPASEFDPKLLSEGIKVEMEHTSDPKIAREIAKDHLMEDAQYYRKLRKVEGKDLSMNYIGKDLSIAAYKDMSGQECTVGHNAERDNCIPKKKDPTSKKPSKQKEQVSSGYSTESDTDAIPAKQRAKASKLVSARREGKGKDAVVILHGGKPAPEHIKPSMIPPAWKKVRVSLDPEADVLVTARDAKGRVKTVYHERFIANNQAAKFSRIQEGLKKFEELSDEIQKDRSNPEFKEFADCAWLMQEQATRPGSDADTKGFEHLYGKKLTKDDFIIKYDNKGKASIALHIGEEKIPMKDEGSREEILRRIKEGEDLDDSTYWLKSFGATTLEDRHVVETVDGVRLRFQGKEGVFHDHLIKNPELASMLLDRKKTASERNGKIFDAGYLDVANYVRKLDGGMFTPKDMRTMKATTMAIAEIKKMGDCCKTPEEYEQRVMEVAAQVSHVLGNRPEQAKLSYISPTVWSVWKNPEPEDANKLSIKDLTSSLKSGVFTGILYRSENTPIQKEHGKANKDWGIYTTPTEKNARKYGTNVKKINVSNMRMLTKGSEEYDELKSTMPGMVDLSEIKKAAKKSGWDALKLDAVSGIVILNPEIISDDPYVGKSLGIWTKGLDLSVKEEESTNDIPGLDADIYFGDPSIPLPNWREVLPEDDDDSDEISDEERDAVERMIGFGSDDFGDDDSPYIPEIRPSPFDKHGKDLSTAQQPKVDLHGKPCGVGQNQQRDGCIPNDGQSQTQQQPVDNATQVKPGSNYSAQFDPSKVKESDKPSEEEVLGTPKKETEDPAKEWKEKGTKSKFFKSWFGDWENDPENASKVVDKETGEPKETGPIRGNSASKVMKEGKPVMVYHGTPNSKFDEFRKDKIHDPEAQLYGPGFYFTEDMEVAETYREKERPYKFTKPQDEILPFIEKAVRGTLTGIAPSQYLQSYIDTLKFAATDNPDPATALNAYVQWLNEEHSVHMDMSSIMEPIGEGTRFNVFLNIRKPFDADEDAIAFSDLSSDMQKALTSTAEEMIGNEMRDYEKKLKKITAELEKASESDKPKWERRHTKYRQSFKHANEKYTKKIERLKSDTYTYGILKGYEFKKKDINEILEKKGYDGITHIGGYAWGKGDRPHRVWIAFEGNQVKSSENQGTFDPNTNDMNKALPRTKKEPKPKVDLTGKPCGRGQSAARTHCKPKDKPAPRKPRAANPVVAKPIAKKPAAAKPAVKKPAIAKVTKPKKLTVTQSDKLARSFYDKFTKSKLGSPEEKIQLESLQETLLRSTNAAIEFMGHNVFRIPVHGKKAVMVDQIIAGLQTAKKANTKVGPPVYDMEKIVPKPPPFKTVKDVVDYLASLSLKRGAIEQMKTKVENLVKSAKKIFNGKDTEEKDKKLQMYEQRIKFISKVSAEFSKKVRERLTDALIPVSWAPYATDPEDFKNRITSLSKNKKDFDVGKTMQKFAPALDFINKGISSEVTSDFKIIEALDGRSFYKKKSVDNPRAAIGVDANLTKDYVLVHEVGHHLECNVPGLREAAVAFVKRRTAKSPDRKLKDLFPKAKYSDDETGNQDDFAKTFGERSSWYVGKTYEAVSEGKKKEFTEIISMGLQHLYSDPVGFAKSDPEYCGLIIKAMRGKV